MFWYVRSNPESHLYLPARHLFTWECFHLKIPYFPRDIRQGKRVSPLLFSSFLPLSSSISEFSLEPRPQTCGQLWHRCWLAQWNSFTILGFQFLYLCTGEYYSYAHFSFLKCLLHTRASRCHRLPSSSEVRICPASLREMRVWSHRFGKIPRRGIAATPVFLPRRIPEDRGAWWAIKMHMSLSQTAERLGACMCVHAYYTDTHTHTREYNFVH